MLPPTRDGTTSEDVDGPPEPEYDDYEAEDDLPLFPITHEVALKDHTKVISALGLDPSGARLVSGSHDYDLKLWDFGGMDLRCKPFKSWEPAGSYYVRLRDLSWLTLILLPHKIHDLKFSNDGSKFLCVSGTVQAKLFDRDGEEL